MKKRKVKRILWVALLLIAVMLIGCASPPVDDGQENATPVEIALSGMKTQFAFGEAFSDDGLVVTVTLSDGSTRTAERDEYTCDVSQYRQDKAGEYIITVKLNGTNITGQYTVTVQEEPVYKWDDDGVLRILAIGNSFADDMMEYVWNIATASGIRNVYLGTLYIGGCTLDTHADNAAADRAIYDYRVNENGVWKTTPAYKMGDAIASCDWDFVTLQQASGSSGIAATYARMDELIAYVHKKLPATAHARLIWHMTWAYQQDSTHGDFAKYNGDQTTMYNRIVSAVSEKVVPRKDIAAIVPNGTAIQNARASFVGDVLTRDGYHLTFDLGRYIAGLALLETLVGLPDDVAFAPVDGYYKAVAIESVKNAVRAPFAVTPSKYDVLTVHDLDADDYTVLDYTLTQGFYNATDKNNFNRIITTDSNLSPKFYATERFTADTLPVGSLIALQAGWSYRPEAWLKDAVQVSRPAETTTRFVEVTLEWWSGYTYRAFNVAKQGKSNIEGQEKAARAAFTVYIPKTPAAESDAFFTDRGYRKLEYTLSQGFWNSTDPDHHSTLITDNASLSPEFFATERFTKEQLPVGSIIVLETGWNFRPDSWVRDGEKQATRPDTVTARYTVVTENWWAGYSLKGFNLNNGEVLTGRETEARAAFTVWIPEA